MTPASAAHSPLFVADVHDVSSSVLVALSLLQYLTATVSLVLFFLWDKVFLLQTPGEG